LELNHRLPVVVTDGVVSLTDTLAVFVNAVVTNDCVAYVDNVELNVVGVT